MVGAQFKLFGGTMPKQARDIIEMVAEIHGVDPHKIVSPCRVRKVYRARIEVAKMLDARRYSTPRIGSILNHDHTTIVFYLGRGKKKPGPLRTKAPKPPAKPRWRKPRIAHLQCKGCFRCKRQSNLIRFAGFDPTDLQWITRPQQQEQRA